jgi:hypothetical protein
MNFLEYFAGFETIINGKNKQSPYDDNSMVEYTKLNYSRLKRWMKVGELNPQLVDRIKQIDKKQDWIIITEHWCGDAAHILPFLVKLAELNPVINLSLQLRDSNSQIDSYLTNGSKSIPILIIRNEKQQDEFIWGPRPKACQCMYLELKEQQKSIEDIKLFIQNWYNNDKGKSLQEELLAFFA